MTVRRGRGPDPNDEQAHLSDDDVERRLSGDAGLGGPVPERAKPLPAPPAPPGPPAPPAKRRGGGRGGVIWRDVALVLVLLAFLAIGARVVLPDNSTALASPTPPASELAVASPTALTVPATRTPTSPPTPTPPAVPSDVIGSLAPEATPTPVPTPTPTATPTLAPGQTPKPTPKPTPPPANLTVFLNVNPPDDGGLYTTGDAGLWTIHVTNKSTGASIASFQASSSGHTVHVPAGVTYTVSATGVGGYAESNGTDCSRKATSAVSYQCTVTEDDVPAGVWVNLSNPDGGDTSSLKVQLDATGASPAGPIGFTSGRAKFTLDAHVPWSIIVTGVPDGFSASDTCSGSSLSNGQLRSCTLTLTPLSSSAGAALTAAASGPNAAFVALPILATVPLRRRRQERDDAVR